MESFEAIDCYVVLINVSFGCCHAGEVAGSIDSVSHSGCPVLPGVLQFLIYFGALDRSLIEEI